MRLPTLLCEATGFRNSPAPICRSIRDDEQDQVSGGGNGYAKDGRAAMYPSIARQEVCLLTKGYFYRQVSGLLHQGIPNGNAKGEVYHGYRYARWIRTLPAFNYAGLTCASAKCQVLLTVEFTADIRTVRANVNEGAKAQNRRPPRKSKTGSLFTDWVRANNDVHLGQGGRDYW